MVQAYTHTCYVINVKIGEKEFSIELGDPHNSESGVLVSKCDSSQKTKSYYKVAIKDIKFENHIWAEAPFTCNLIPHDTTSATAIRYNPNKNTWNYKDF